MRTGDKQIKDMIKKENFLMDNIKEFANRRYYTPKIIKSAFALFLIVFLIFVVIVIGMITIAFLVDTGEQETVVNRVVEDDWNLEQECEKWAESKERRLQRIRDHFSNPEVIRYRERAIAVEVRERNRIANDDAWLDRQNQKIIDDWRKEEGQPNPYRYGY